MAFPVLHNALRNLYDIVDKGEMSPTMCLAPGTENIPIFSSSSGHYQYIIVKMKKGEKEKYFCEGCCLYMLVHINSREYFLITV